MSAGPPAERVDPWAEAPVAPRLLDALTDALPHATTFGVIGAATPTWTGLDSRSEAADLGSDGDYDVIVVASPDALPLDPAHEETFVANLTRRSSAVMLATVSPATAVVSPGRWPAYWQARFAAVGWRFADLLRPALWDDSFLSPDVKEGALLFVAPEISPTVPSSPAVAKVHPDRLVTMHRATRADVAAMRIEIEERERSGLSELRSAMAELNATLDRERIERHVLEAKVAVAERRLVLLSDHLLVSPQASSLARRQRRIDWRWFRPSPVDETQAQRRLDPIMVALFDPLFYAQHSPEAAAAPLAHYLHVGEGEGRRPNPYFDPAFYRANQPDVVEAGMGALEHYARYGGAEGRAASAEFDTAFYVASHPDVRLSGIHPMLHYLVVGEAHGMLAVAPP